MSPAARDTGAAAGQIAVDIHHDGVTVAEVIAGTPPKAGRFGTAPLDARAWTDEAAASGLVSDAVRAALASAGIVTSHAVVVIPRQFATVRTLRLPPASRDQLAAMVRLEAQEHVPFALDDAVVDQCIVEEAESAPGAEDDLVPVMLVAARRDVVEAVLKAFDGLGIAVDRLTLSTLALSGHLADRLEPTALIDVSGTDVNVVATAEGRLVFNRAAVLSGAQASIPNRFEAEVIRSFAAYQREHRARVLARILVSGAGAPGLDLTSAAGLVAAAVEVPTGGLKDSVYDTSVAGIGPHAIALGAARQELSGPIAPINLIPEERLLRRATAARKRRQNLVALAAAAIVLIALVGVQRIMAYRADNDRRTQQANADYLAVQSRLDAARPAHDELVADHTALMAGLDPTRPVVDVMEAVSANLPQGGTLWLTQFDFARGGVITLRGETRSESAVTDLVLNLLHCGKFSDVHLTFLGDAETTSTNTAAGPATTADVKMPPLPGFSTPPAQSSATPPAAQPAAPAKAAPAPAPAGPAPSQTRGPAAASPSHGFGSFQFDPSRLSTLPPDVQQRIRDRLRQGGGAAGTAAGGPPPPPPPPPAAAITKVATRGPSVQPADRRVVTTGGARLTLARAPSPSHTLRAAPRARSHTLETFIITLRVNPRASSLVISPSDRLTAHLTSASPGAARHAAAPIDTGSGDFTEGGDDAGQ